MSRPDGSALLMCLLVMAVALMLGLSGARIALQEERAARNDRDRKAAFQAAEAALLDAQRDIEQPASAGQRRPARRAAGFGGASVAGRLRRRRRQSAAGPMRRTCRRAGLACRRLQG